ncbi:hypothetical protein ACWD4P_03595 [Kitasatospora sp. NPDC002543]
MTHNAVARRTAPELPARRLIPRDPACESQVPSAEATARRALVRELPLRALHRDGGGGR